MYQRARQINIEISIPSRRFDVDAPVFMQISNSRAI
jgi:hypothetical protein